MSDLHHFIDLLSIKKLTEKKLYALLAQYRSPQRITNAPRSELITMVGSECAHNIVGFQRTPAIERLYETAERHGITVLPYYDPVYPSWLKAIPGFPPVLFIRGMILPEDETALAVVGTRGATVYGKNIAERFTTEFVRAGVTIISGMARGIDTVAHETALKNNGRTIAVLGCGVDRCYPPENNDLMHRIIENGAVISEFTLNTPPLAQNFPKRNRIVSGLSRAVIAIEAKEKSGVMNTVTWAAEQNKDVFAVPGNIYSQTSSGTNRLIKEGAIPVTSAQEVLALCGIAGTSTPAVQRKIDLTATEQTLWQHLSLEPVYLDVLSDTLNQPSGTVLAILLGMEIKGFVQQLPGMMFVRAFDR
jgi:DNA processing protein